jgi:hypothetical protein
MEVVNRRKNTTSREAYGVHALTRGRCDKQTMTVNIIKLVTARHIKNSEKKGHPRCNW